MNLVKINPNYSKNLFPKIIAETTEVVTTSGTATYTNEINNIFGTKSLKVNCTSYKTTDLSFNFGDKIATIVKVDGTYFFSFGLKSDNDINLQIEINVTRKGTETFDLAVIGDTKNYQYFSQAITLLEDDDVNFTITLIKDAAAISNNIDFLLDAFKLELNSGIGMPVGFSMPENTTGWQRMADFVNTQNITANTDTLITYSGFKIGGGDLQLINANAKVTPIQLNDTLNIDFTFTFPSPAGTDDFVKVFLKVNGIIYRGTEFNILEPTGEINYVSVSFSLPVESDFLLNGAEIYIRSNVAIVISNRYLFVQRIFKAV